jgi:hypothetical protein
MQLLNSGYDCFSYMLMNAPTYYIEKYMVAIKLITCEIWFKGKILQLGDHKVYM